MDGEELIDKIEEIRSRNNANWMNLLRLAYRHAPRETAGILAAICSFDSEINDLARRLQDAAESKAKG